MSLWYNSLMEMKPPQFVCTECDDVAFSADEPHAHEWTQVCFCGSGKPLSECHPQSADAAGVNQTSS